MRLYMCIERYNIAYNDRLAQFGATTCGGNVINRPPFGLTFRRKYGPKC